MKHLFSVIVLLILTSCYKSDEADLIIHNATIYSCDEEFNVYEAMAIRDGKILQMGPEREILNGYKCDNIIDAGKAPVYPGFIDAHCHFKGYAKTLNEVDLIGTMSFPEMVERITKFEETNTHTWILGRGWDHTLWNWQEFPTNDTLNALFPEKPVYFARVDGHAALVNQAALDLAGITPESEIMGGEILVKDGKCTGLLMDNAVDLIKAQIPKLTSEELLPFMQEAEANLFEVGLTSINDAGMDEFERDQYIQWYKNGDLKIKDYSMLAPTDDNLKFANENGQFKEGNLSIRSFKVYSDGALGSRGACLIDPYSDDPYNHGFLVTDTAIVRDIAEFAVSVNYQVNTHCIGDSANRIILGIYEDVIGSVADHRWRIEHAQVLHPDDFEFFQINRIIPSVQPTHCTSDMRWAEQRLGAERVKYAYAYQTLLDMAGKLALGTDFPVERINPLETFYAAVSRMDREGYPEGGFQTNDAISREDALKGMTIWAAYASFSEHDKGSLEKGKAADFVILTKDIMKVDYPEILTTFVESTYLDGELVYSAD